jgi:hypothetical protein
LNRVGVVAHEAFYATREQVEQQAGIVLAVEVFTDAIKMRQRFFGMIAPKRLARFSAAQAMESTADLANGSTRRANPARQMPQIVAASVRLLPWY